MQRILILSYFFPPCNLTPSQRVVSWAKYLADSGYYPVIITRRWDYRINSPADMSIATPDNILYEKYNNYEVYYLPYKPDLKDRILNKYGENKYKFVRKLLTFTGLLLQNITDIVIPFKNFYNFSLNYLQQNKDINKMIITANPYILFKFGYKLNRKTSIRWIADYRDAWTNCKIKHLKRNKLFKLINWYDSYFEKKWVKSAVAISSVSDTLAFQIDSLVKVNNHIALHNGFIADDFTQYRTLPKFDDFTISYIGTLFYGQKIELFLNAFTKFVDLNKGEKIKFFMPGLAYNSDLAAHISYILKGYEDYYSITGRIDRQEVLKIEIRSHLLLYVAWQGYQGIIPSKIYEYIASGTPILLAPSDKDAVENIITQSQCGLITYTVDDILKILINCFNDYKNNKFISNDINSTNVQQFSRYLQTLKLKDLLDKI